MHQAPQTIALYGGTFNPVHRAHVELVKQSLHAFEFSAFHVLPSYMPDYKAAPVAAQHRLAMLQLALASFAAVQIDTREIQRQGMTYTIDTVREYRQEYGEDVALFFIMGSDSWQSFNTWHDWQEILTHVNIVIVNRAQSVNMAQKKSQAMELEDELLKEYTARICKDKSEFMRSLHGKLFEFEDLSMNVSSTNIRKALLQQKNTDDVLLPAVRAYIDKHQLYGEIKN